MFVHNCGYTLRTVCACLYVQYIVYTWTVLYRMHRYVNLLGKITVWLGRSKISRNDDISFTKCFDWLITIFFECFFFFNFNVLQMSIALYFLLLYACSDWSIDAGKIYGMVLVSAQSWDCTHPIKSPNFYILFICDLFYTWRKVVESGQHNLDNLAQFQEC